ncbi:coagulation factor XI-like [Notolabrus celidotus]|uniref:coagulation factor XI-like n=1 Tax=Notolabrus celidotus TaxID=1203425 RepID=UPI00149070E7|nr:coagulation factor XI-like [Notolabrus celidotus]
MRARLILLGVLSMCSMCFSQECNTEFLENVDFPGTDKQVLFSPDAAHCQHLCTQYSACQFFTFVRSDWTRDKRHFYCYLKSTPTGQPNRRTPLRGVTSGFSLKPCSPAPQPCLSKVYQNIDFLGADYQTFFTADYEGCQRACTQDPSCQFFTFVNNVFTPENIRNKCHLKFSWSIPQTPVVEATAGVVSGFSHKTQMSQMSDTACQGKLFPNTATQGNFIQSLPTAIAEHCLSLCSAHPSCTFFTFHSENFTCNLKNNQNEMVLRAQAGATSGIPERFCQLDTNWAKVPLDGIDFRSSVIRYVLMDDAETCQRTCTEDVNCQFYTYVHSSFHNSEYWRRCYLKRTITMPSPPKIAKLSNVVSGFTLRNCQGVV